MPESLFSWAVVGTVLGILITIGLALTGYGLTIMGPATQYFEAAKVVFHLTVLVLLLKTGVWLIGQRPTGIKGPVMAFILFGSIGSVWMIAIQLINSLEGGKPATAAPQANEQIPAQSSLLVIPPNIVCLGENPLDVEIDSREVLRRSGFHRLHAVMVTYCNQSNPPNEVGRVDSVTAQVLYYDWDFPGIDERLRRVYYPCWLDEEFPRVSFPVNKVHQLVIGVFEHAPAGSFRPSFTIYENDRDRSVRLRPFLYANSKGFRIKIKLIAGEGGKSGREDEFELRITERDGSAGYEFYYLTE